LLAEVVADLAEGTVVAVVAVDLESRQELPLPQIKCTRLLLVDLEPELLQKL
jgi:hypothetical protein